MVIGFLRSCPTGKWPLLPPSYASAAIQVAIRPQAQSMCSSHSCSEKLQKRWTFRSLTTSSSAPWMTTHSRRATSVSARLDCYDAWRMLHTPRHRRPSMWFDVFILTFILTSRLPTTTMGVTRVSHRSLWAGVPTGIRTPVDASHYCRSIAYLSSL
jgi:hypothetical protein